MKNITTILLFSFTALVLFNSSRPSDSLNGKCDSANISNDELPYFTKDLNFSSDKNILAGKLYAPREAKGYPVIIYVEGSDNGNTNESPYVRALAKGFTANGVGLFSFNKRGYNGSGGTPNEDFDIRATDVVSAYKFLLSFPDLDTSLVGIYGISQAGWVIPRALRELKKISYLVLVSPAGVTAIEQTTFYLQNQWRKAGMDAKDIEHATDLREVVAHYYSTGAQPDYQNAQALVNKSLKEPWFSLFNKTDYREEVPESGKLITPAQLADTIRLKPDEYSFYRTDQNLHVDSMLYFSITSPVLMIYGGKDDLVPVEKSMSIFQKVFSQNQNPDVTFRVYKQAGHDIQPVGSPYLTDGYREFMSKWIKEHVKTK